MSSAFCKVRPPRRQAAMRPMRLLLFLSLLTGLMGLLGASSSGRGALEATPALAVPPAAPVAQDSQPIDLPGRVTEALNLRSEPRVAPDTLLRTLSPNDPVWVYEAVTSNDGDTWYRVGDDQYVHAAEVRLPRTPPEYHSGRWIDADLQEPALLTAYEDDRAVYSALTLFGRAATETAKGEHQILRRVEDETMDSATSAFPATRRRATTSSTSCTRSTSPTTARRSTTITGPTTSGTPAPMAAWASTSTTRSGSGTGPASARWSTSTAS